MDLEKEYKKGQELYNQGKYEQAIEKFKEINKEFPQKNHVLVYISLAYMKLEDWEGIVKYGVKYVEKIPDSEKIIDSDEDMHALKQSIGVALARLEDYDQALEYFKEAIVHEANPLTITYAGQACWNLGHEKAAVSFWRTAAKAGNNQAILALNTRGYDIEN